MTEPHMSLLNLWNACKSGISDGSMSHAYIRDNHRWVLGLLTYKMKLDWIWYVAEVFSINTFLKMAKDSGQYSQDEGDELENYISAQTVREIV